MPMEEMNQVYIPTGYMPIEDAAISGEPLDLTADYQEPNAGVSDAEPETD